MLVKEGLGSDYDFNLFVCFFFFKDGESSDCFRLLSNGSYSQRRKTIHFRYLQEDKESRVQCVADSEVHSKVKISSSN